MSAAAVGALAAGGFVAGVLLIVGGWVHTRRPALIDRVAPYVPDAVPSSRIEGQESTSWQDVVRARWTAVADVIGSADSVRRRLDRLGSAMSVEDFRVRQLRWAGGAAAVAVALSLTIAARRPTAPFALVIFCLVTVFTVAWWCDHDLSRRVETRERSMVQEFPTVADLLALAVAAGESPVAATQRVASLARGDLADELRRVVSEVHAGGTIADSFDALASRTGVASIARFAEALAAAIERGTPLVDVLHAQSADVREAARRDLIETGGRREVLMMIPVVFLILPVTVIFAFYPGLVGLQLTSGS